LTSADVSRYQTSALIGAEPLEHLAGPRSPSAPGPWRTEAGQVAATGARAACGQQRVEAPFSRNGDEQRDGHSAVRDLERLARGNAPEPGTRTSGREASPTPPASARSASNGEMRAASLTQDVRSCVPVHPGNR
jgi:hypothetical protein